MRKINVLLFFILFTHLGYSQAKLSPDFEVELGEPYAKIDVPTKNYFSDGKGNALSIKSDEKRVIIQRYNALTLQEVSKKTYDDFPTDKEVQRILRLGDRLFYIFSSEGDKNESLFSREVNMEDGTFGVTQTLISTTSEINYLYEVPKGMKVLGVSGPDPVRFEIFKSFDNTRLLIRYRLKPKTYDDSKNRDVLGFYVFNTSLEKQWGGEVEMPYTEKEMNNLTCSVTKDGEAFMLAYINKSKQIELLNITNDLNVKISPIKVKGVFTLQELKLRETADGNLVYVGYYTNGLEYKFDFNGGNISTTTNGILALTIDHTGNILENFQFEFPIAIVNQYESEKQVIENQEREKEAKAGIPDLRLRALELNEDGSTIVIGERQYRTYQSMSMGPTVNQSVNFNYGSIVAAKFDKVGKLLWMKKIPKMQSGVSGQGGMGIKYIKGIDVHYILYLDNIKNIDLAPDQVPKKHLDDMGGFLTAYKIDDATGNIEKHPILNTRDVKGKEISQFRVSRIVNVSEKVFMLEVSMNMKKDALIKINLTK